MSERSVTGHDLRAGLPAVIGAVVAWGATGVIIKAIEMDSLSIAAWRFLAYAALLTGWMLLRGGRLTRGLLTAALPGGLFLAGDVMLFFTAVQLTSIVNATTIGALQPIVIATFATRVLSETIAPREYGAAFVAIESNEQCADGITRAMTLAGEGRPVLVDVRIDYSKRTRFTEGVVKATLKRFTPRDKLRVVSRALWRRVTG